MGGLNRELVSRDGGRAVASTQAAFSFLIGSTQFKGRDAEDAGGVDLWAGAGIHPRGLEHRRQA